MASISKVERAWRCPVIHGHVSERGRHLCQVPLPDRDADSGAMTPTLIRVGKPCAGPGDMQQSGRQPTGRKSNV